MVVEMAGGVGRDMTGDVADDKEMDLLEALGLGA